MTNLGPNRYRTWPGPVTGDIDHPAAYMEQWQLWLQKEHFRHFLRIYDRRHLVALKDFIDQKYPMINVKPGSRSIEITKWCHDTYGKFGFLTCGGVFIFTTEQEALMFKLRWSECLK